MFNLLSVKGQPLSAEMVQKLVQRGNQAVFNGDYDLARKAYTRVLQLDPKNEDALLGMVDITRSDDGKTRILQRILEINPENERVAEALSRRARVAKAVAKSRKLNPTISHGWIAPTNKSFLIYRWGIYKTEAHGSVTWYDGHFSNADFERGENAGEELGEVLEEKRRIGNWRFRDICYGSRMKCYQEFEGHVQPLLDEFNKRKWHGVRKISIGPHVHIINLELKK